MRKTSYIDNQNRNISILYYAYCVIIIVFITKLFFIQIIKHSSYQALAEDQYWNLSVVPPKRGDIYSSDNFILAGTQMYYLLYAEPKKVENPHETAHKLSKVLTEITRQRNLFKESEDNDSGNDSLDDKKDEELYGIYYNKILSDIQRDLYYVVIEHNLTPPEKQLIEQENIKAIGFEDEPVRFYPEESIASNVLGFVAFNGEGERQGYFGIEGALNGDLKGKSGRILEERDALGNPILIGGFKKSTPIKGRDIVLTINKAIQYMVEKKLRESIELYDAKSGCVIIMDPFTGSIIAMANFPTYSPTDFSEMNTEELEPEFRHKKVERRNLCISETYEPGSVIKPLTISSAIELDKISPDTTFEDKGPVVYSDYTIDNWDRKHHGIQTIRQLLEKSNNIGAAWVGSLVGAKDLSYFLKEYGLGMISDIDLEGEDTGVIRDFKGWTDIDTVTAAFGQGISATPLQVLNAFNVFANGGFLVQPKIIEKIIDGDKVIEIPSKQIKRVISLETADTMTDLLTSAAESGEAKYFFLKNYYSIAGKTGTAQIPVDGKYHSELTNATFVGYMAKSKKFSMIVKIEEPQLSIYAAETAAPLWTDIANEVIKYYGLIPDKNIN